MIVKIWKKIPNWMRTMVRAVLTFIRRVFYGWNGVTVSLAGVEFLVPHKSGSEFRRAKKFATAEPSFSGYFSEHAKKSAVIFDIGAAVGTYTMFAAKLNPSAQVIAFEPEPNNHKALLRNISVNHIDNVSVLNIALGDQNDAISFVGESAGIAGIGTHRLSNSNNPDAETVQVKIADELVAAKKIPPPAMMKIDVEGFEVRALRGLQNTIEQFRPVILIEIHPKLIADLGDSKQEIDDLFDRLNYGSEIISDGSTKPGKHKQVHMIYFPKS